MSSKSSGGATTTAEEAEGAALGVAEGTTAGAAEAETETLGLALALAEAVEEGRGTGRSDERGAEVEEGPAERNALGAGSGVAELLSVR